MLDILKTFQVGYCTPGMSGWGDIVDVLEELADTNRPGHHHDRRWRVSRAGLNLESVDVAHVLRLGLEALIEAHAIVEGQRDKARAEIKRRERVAQAGCDQAVRAYNASLFAQRFTAEPSLVNMAWETY
jgi:hypothetical protein